MTLEQSSIGTGVPKNASENKSSELELKLIAKSKDKLASKKDDVEMIRPWGDYTLCANKEDAEKIFIYNDKLENIASIKKVISINIANVAFDEVPSNGGFSSNTIVPSQYQKLSPLVKYALDMESKCDIKKGNNYYQDSIKTTKFPEINKNLTILEEGKYVTLVDKKMGYYLAFVTENAQGIKLDPADWEQFSTGRKKENIPKDLEEKILEIFKQKNEIRELNDKYSSILTDVGINIVSKDDVGGKVIFSENLPSIRSNIAIDPTNKNILYFCQEGVPGDIIRLDMSQDPSTWKAEYAPIKAEYKEIKNLSLDPTGAFFIFYSGMDLVMATKDKFEEIKRMGGGVKC